MLSALAKVNWVDIFILILLFRTSYIGVTQGLSYEIMTLVAVIVAMGLSLYNYAHVSVFFNEKLNLPVDFSNFLSFLILSGGTLILFSYARNTFYRYVKLEIFPNIEKYGGLILGFIRGCLLGSLVLLCLLLLPSSYVEHSIKETSVGATLLLRVAPVCYRYSVGMFPRFRDAVQSNKLLKDIFNNEPSQGKVKSHINNRVKK